MGFGGLGADQPFKWVGRIQNLHILALFQSDGIFADSHGVVVSGHHIDIKHLHRIIQITEPLDNVACPLHPLQYEKALDSVFKYLSVNINQMLNLPKNNINYRIMIHHTSIIISIFFNKC